MKMWIARDTSGALWIYNKRPQPFNTIFLGGVDNQSMQLSDDSFPEVTFENSPMGLELKVKHSGMHLSPMFRLLDMIVIKDPSDRKRIVAYTKKLIDKLKEEGFDADARVAEGYFKMFNGESIAMATMDEVELKLIEK